MDRVSVYLAADKGFLFKRFDLPGRKCIRLLSRVGGHRDAGLRLGVDVKASQMPRSIFCMDIG
jgi:hypothetical protein